MPSEMEFVNYKEFVESLTETESPDSADKIVISNPTNGPRAVPGSAKDRSTTLTAFREGDTIPVDGTPLAKMPYVDLLRVTAENALRSIILLSGTVTDGYLAVGNANGPGKMNTSVIFNNFAGKFVQNETNAFAGKFYIYEGELYRAKENYNGTWNSSKFEKKTLSEYLENLLENNLLDVLYSYPYTSSRTSHEITYSGDPSTRTIHVSGTATGISFFNIIDSQSAMPSGLKPGDTISFEVSGLTENGVFLRLFYYPDTLPGRNIKITSNTSVVIPSACTGMILRLEVANGTALPVGGVDVKFKLLNKISFSEIERLFAGVDNSIRDLNKWANKLLGEKIPFVVQSFDASLCTDNVLIGVDGIESAFNGYSASGYIEVGSEEIYYKNKVSSVTGSKGYCYDLNKKPIGAPTQIETSNGITKLKTLQGTAFIRFSLSTSDKASTYLYKWDLPIGMFSSEFGVKRYGETFAAFLSEYCRTLFADVVIQQHDSSQDYDDHLINNLGQISSFTGYAVTNPVQVGSEEYFYRNAYIASLTGSAGVCFDSLGNALGYAVVVETSDGVTKERTLPGTKYVRFTITMAVKASFSVYARYMPSSDFVQPANARVLPDFLGQNVHQIIQNITKTINNYSNAYNNTYNITTTPNITTDSHGWLVSVDTDTQDETNKTDMTGAIMSMLTDTGYCHLGEGIFYVSGGIDMPDHSMLVGCGDKTIIRLLSSVQSGYILKLGSDCSVQDLTLSGGYSSPAINEEDPVGTRHGVYFKGNSNGNEGDVVTTTRRCLLSNLRILNFAGGGITCHNTGYHHSSSILATNCIISSCHAGINIDFFSEYNRFTNMMIYNCHYACINNGGNNIFVACTFQGITGFVIDNSEGDKTNNAHGSCVGCSFNHQNDNVGNAIEIYGIINEFVFTGCQIFYGMIYIENSSGVVITSCNFGANESITVLNGGLVLFANNSFAGTPTITIENNQNVKFESCYTRSGSVVDNS